jgi:hypothetical protein
VIAGSTTMSDERFDPNLHDLRQWVAAGGDAVSKGNALIGDWTARREALLARAKAADPVGAKACANAAEAYMVSVSILEKILLRMQR